VGLIIQCLSDNRNRSVAEVRHLLQRHNGTLAGSNQVMRNFARRGQILVDAEGVDEDS
jgi:transcriptional/translational regulatory protein YebC/TACO1